MSDQPSEIPSPCISMCTLDANDTCMGCLRTLQEILAWRDGDEETRRAILSNVAARHHKREG